MTNIMNDAKLKKSLSPYINLFVFGLIGPPVGEILIIWLIDPTLPLLASLWVVLIPGYAIGLVPALVAGNIDALIERKGAGPVSRLISAGLGGVVGSFVILLPLYLAELIHGTYPLLLCMVSAVSAIFCFLLVFIARRILS